MTPRYYHTPPHPVSTRVRCPVCHQEVYSRVGIHPQCAVRQADPPKPKGGQGRFEPGVKPVEPVGIDVVVDPPIAAIALAADRRPIPAKVNRRAH